MTSLDRNASLDRQRVQIKKAVHSLKIFTGTEIVNIHGSDTIFEIFDGLPVLG
jgi:hypothetical protein